MTQLAPHTLRLLASGSSGNATIIQHQGTVLLLDAGISLKRLKKGLQELGLGVGDVDGVLLTHEHSDHIKGVEMLVKYFPDVALYASAGTRQKLPARANFNLLSRGDAVSIGSLTCHAYATQHDANEPLGFRFEGSDGLSVGWATDLGEWDEETVEHLMGCQVMMIEANHDREMLRHGPYPGFLKRRVGGARGHLSNLQAMRLLERVAGPQLERVLLGHLSEKNNKPGLALAHVGTVLEGSDVALSVAERKSASPLVEVSAPELHPGVFGKAQQVLF